MSRLLLTRSIVAKFAVFRLDCTPGRASLEELEKKRQASRPPLPAIEAVCQAPASHQGGGLLPALCGGSPHRHTPASLPLRYAGRDVLFSLDVRQESQKSRGPWTRG